MPPEILRTPVRRPVDGRPTPVRKEGDQATLNALQAHIDTLKSDIERLTAELAGERTAHLETRTAHQGQLTEAERRLVTERERADRAIAELVDLARRLAPTPGPPHGQASGRLAMVQTELTPWYRPLPSRARH
jgi:hypothetical protein